MGNAREAAICRAAERRACRCGCGVAEPRLSTNSCKSAGVDRVNALSDTRVALPVDCCHLTGANVGFEWTKVADAGFASFQRDFVVAGW
jgi:hypothetical protein